MSDLLDVGVGHDLNNYRIGRCSLDSATEREYKISHQKNTVNPTQGHCFIPPWTNRRVQRPESLLTHRLGQPARSLCLSRAIPGIGKKPFYFSLGLRQYVVLYCPSVRIYSSQNFSIS